MNGKRNSRGVRLLAWKLAFIAVLISNDARASWVDGNELYDSCTSDNLFKAASCLNYVIGALDGNPSIKTPASATRGQVRDVVVKYLKDHPADRDLPAGFLVYLAVRDAWPTLQPKATSSN